jgi:hypothetical protein
MDPFTRLTEETALTLAQDDGVELAGQRFVPDDSKGFIKFKLSHGFPVYTAYGQGIHPNVIAMSHGSLLHQNFNVEHQMKSYQVVKPGDRNRSKDRMIGTIVAVDYPNHTKTVGGDPKPITAVASFAKAADGVDKIIGEHQSGRHNWSVSMEVSFAFSLSGFAIEMSSNGKQRFDSSPQDMVNAGWDYVPWSDASPKLLETFSKEKNRMVGMFQNRKTLLMLGGLDSPVHYAGVGLVRYGAEKEAGIEMMAASAKGTFHSGPFAALPILLAKALEKK